MTVVTDHDTNQVVWVGEGTGKVVLEKFFKLLTAEQRDRITLGRKAGILGHSMTEMKAPRSYFFC